jgi:post-segregation antitoxin (ccd killing protein)
MKTPRRNTTGRSKRRTTLTLPADSLSQAERIARSRGVNLSVVVGEALTEGLRRHTAAARGEEVLKAYQRAFGGLSDEEMATLDGVILKPIPKRRK